MSSEDDDSSRNIRVSDQRLTTNKRRKVARACDTCRLKKIRCDASDKREGEKCTPCVLYTRDCTFVEGTEKKGPPKGYFQYLENRINRLEEALRRLAPAYDIEGDIGPRHTESSWTAMVHRDIPHLLDQRTQTTPFIRPQLQTPHHVPVQNAVSQSLPMSISYPNLRAEIAAPSRSATPSLTARAIPHETEGPDSSGEEEGFTPAGPFQYPEGDLLEQFSKLRLGKTTFIGKSSNVHLLHYAMSLKNEITGRNDDIWPEVPPERRWQARNGSDIWGTLQRSQMPPVEVLKFPPPDLSDTLIALYFRFFHPLCPTLHRPSFESQVKEGLHKKNFTHGLQFLLVCAIGSRWSVDPRVCEIQDITVPQSAPVDWKLAGWPYFSQVMHFFRPFSYTSSLLDLQNTLLLGFFGWSSQLPHSAWLLAGHGVRCAMDLGAHRRKAYLHDRPLLNEVWKRTFWCLVNLDRMTSSTLGRPAAVNDEDIDADLPLDANDDSWDETFRTWKPNNRPSHMQYFIHSTKLNQIIAFAMRTIYSINRSRAHLGLVGEEWERSIVSELDSALNDWADNIPNHLRWDPNIADPIHFDQAVALNVSYHYAQIVAHRRFMPGSNKQPSSLAFTSLAICTNAARSISHIVDAHLKWILARNQAPNPAQQYPAAISVNLSVPFLAGVILLISIWGAKRSRRNVDVAALADDVQKILRCLKFAEERHVLAGTLSETLHELASAGDFPLNPDGESFFARSASKRARTEADGLTTGTRGPQDRSSYQEPTPATSSLPRWPTSSSIFGQTHSLTHGFPFTELPPAVGTFDLQTETRQASGPARVNSTITTDIPHFVSSNFFSAKSDSHLPWVTPANRSEFGPSTAIIPPITAAGPLAGSSNLSRGVDIIDSAAAAYFKTLGSGPDISYGYPHQLLQQTPEASGLGGDDPQHTNTWDPILQQPTTNPAGLDWESWISDIWGLYDVASSTQ